MAIGCPAHRGTAQAAKPVPDKPAAEKPAAREPGSTLPDPDRDADMDLDDLLDEIEGEQASPGAPVGTPPADTVFRGGAGFVEFRPRVYFRDRGGRRNDEQMLFRAELELEFAFQDGVTGFARPRVYVDARDGDLKRFEPFEAYLTFGKPTSTVDLRVGQFVENWGVADTFNPIDIVNRRDLATDFLDLDRLGELGARLRIKLEDGASFGEPTFSLYYLPAWRPTPFAPPDQRFGFGSPGLTFDEDQQFAPSGFERSFFATRFQSTLSTGPADADLQLLAARGPDRQPSIFTRGGTLAPAYFGAWTFGAGIRAVPNEDVAGSFLASLTLKAEAVYKRPFQFDGAPIHRPDDYVAYVFGFDRQFFGVLSDQDAVTLTVEYARENGASDFTRSFRPFRNDLILRGLWEANDFARSSLELRGLFDLESDEFILEGIFERQLRMIDEDLKFIAQVQIFEPAGDGSSLFDFFPNNSSAAIGLRWDF